MNDLELMDFCSPQAVDIVIMDINMPLMDGLEDRRELLKKYLDIKVFGLSMFNDRNYISDLLKAGAHGYILKKQERKSL